jgi:GTP-binding protein HflX
MKALVTNIDHRTERVFLVGAEFRSRRSWEVEDSLAELAALTRTAGGEVAGEGIQRLEGPVAATFIGSGKAAEFATFCRENEIDTVIFDDELSAAQTRNLEKLFVCKILDRTSLILDIFAQRARTREGQLQVELAQLQHLLPRLTRFWSHLSRQKGGIGMRGEGETQLETDRRRVQDRIAKLGRELDEVRRQRTTQREGRKRHAWPMASVVGYTNAGKSTLLNALTGAAVLAEDKLFATLDPTTRRLRLPTNQNVLLSDTVGFIRKLPHGLVEAFKATLEEVVLADLLIHVVDISHPGAADQVIAVQEVLAEIGAVEKPTLMVLNKVDQLASRVESAAWVQRYPGSVAVSARTGEGFPALLAELGSQLRPERELVDLEIPLSQPALLARLRAIGQVVQERYTGQAAHLRARIPPQFLAEFQARVVVAPARRQGRKAKGEGLRAKS